MGKISTGSMIAIAGGVGLVAYLVLKPKTATVSPPLYYPTTNPNSSSATTAAAIAAGGSVVTSLIDNIWGSN